MAEKGRIYTEKQREIPVYDDFDVIVVGAGLAGCCAAIAAGRQGVKTLLVERSGMLGGVATASMMASITNYFFDSNDRQIIKGIPGELVNRLVEAGAASPHWRHHRLPQIPHHADVMQVILFHMLREAGVQLLLHTIAADAIVKQTPDGSENILEGIVMENKAGRQAVYGKLTVDCSGDADVAFLAGAATEYPEKDASTVMCEMGNVDLQKTYEYYKAHPEDFDEAMDVPISFADFENNWLARGIFHTPHNGGYRNALLQNAIREGRYAREKGMANRLDAFGLFGTRGSQRVLVNSNFFTTDPVGDVAQLSLAELEGRERCLELGALLVDIMPGFETAFVTRTAAEIGIRLTRSIVGETVLSYDDFINLRGFADAVCDMPAISKDFSGKKIIDKAFGMPYSAFLPKGIDNLLVGSGKTVSTDRLTRWKYLRGQAITMLFGETTGIAAALAAKSGKSAKTLDLAQLKAEIKNCNG